VNLSESVPTSAPIAQFGMDQVREQFHAIYGARAGPGEVSVGVHGENPVIYDCGQTIPTRLLQWKAEKSFSQGMPSWGAIMARIRVARRHALGSDARLHTTVGSMAIKRFAAASRSGSAISGVGANG